MASKSLELRQQPIRIRINRQPNSCTAALCNVPSAGYVAWLTPGWAELRVQAVCLGHLMWAKTIGGCLALPAQLMPPMDVLGPAVQREIERRRAAQYAGTINSGYGAIFNITFSTSW